MARIFISYARADGKAEADILADRLLRLGHEVFQDVDKILAGDAWEYELLRRIRWSDVLISLVTPASMVSKYVYFEFEEALRRKKLIIPVIVRDTPLPGYLHRINALRLTGNNWDGLLLQIERAIRQYFLKRLFQRIILAAALILTVVIVLAFAVFRSNSASGNLPDSTQDSVANEVTKTTTEALTTNTTSPTGTLETPTLTLSDTPEPPTLTSTPFGGGSGQIAFDSDRDGNRDIYLMDLATGDVKRLTNNPAYDGIPEWSPDGSKIVFISQRDGGDGDIFVMNADGSDERNLTVLPVDANEWNPTWSPDGEYIAFVSDRAGTNDIYIMDNDGKNIRQLTNNALWEWKPSWSSDGTEIVCQVDALGYMQLYKVDVITGVLHRLTNTGATDGIPTWSPDGNSIAFLSDRDGDASIYLMDTEGTNVTRLTSASSEIVSWSPDGSQIAFSRIPALGNSDEIYVVNINTKELRRLTNNGNNDLSPAWRP
jgi:TolB protein